MGSTYSLAARCLLGNRMAMFDAALSNRPGRIIALGRLALAVVFLLAIWLDPTQPAVAPASGYLVLGLYVALAALYLGATWNDWYRDWRFARPAHLVDIAMFAVMVYLTEGYTSPFYTQFVFLILAAAIRWTWRATALTAAIVILLFFAVGIASIEFGNGEFELQRFLFRGAYLFVLSLMLIWFGINQNRPRRDRAAIEMAGNDPESDAGRLAGFAARAGGARFAALLWTDSEEPWVNLALHQDNAATIDRLPPKSLDEIVPTGKRPRAAIVDFRRREQLTVEGRSFRRSPLAAGFGSSLEDIVLHDVAIVAPFRSEDLTGALILAEIPGLCDNHICVAAGLATEIEDALARRFHRRLAGETAAAEVRLALARDLHDSLAQILAGTAMRLETVRRRARGGTDVDGEINALQAELSLEQRDLRGLIARLRGLGDEPDRVSLSASLAWLGQRLARQWGVAVEIGETAFPDAISGEFDYQLRQIVREATANAVRHGAAKTVRIGVTSEGQRMLLEITDDGCGYGHADSAGKARKPAKPKSLRERVRRLGGELDVVSSAEGTAIAVRVPRDRVL